MIGKDARFSIRILGRWQAWLAAIAAVDAPYSAFVAPFIVSGAGMGLFFAPIANVVLSAVRRDEEGKASGANNAIREVGGVFGVAVLASVFSANGSYLSPQSYVDGLIPAVWVGAAVVAVAAVAGLFIPARVVGQVPTHESEQRIAQLTQAEEAGAAG